MANEEHQVGPYDPKKDSPIVQPGEKPPIGSEGANCVWGGTYGPGAYVCDGGVKYTCLNGTWVSSGPGSCPH